MLYRLEHIGQKIDTENAEISGRDYTFLDRRSVGFARKFTIAASGAEAGKPVGVVVKVVGQWSRRLWGEFERGNEGRRRRVGKLEEDKTKGSEE